MKNNNYFCGVNRFSEDTEVSNILGSETIDL